MSQIKSEQKPIWWNVTMDWGDSDEGTYSDSFLATDEEAAKLQCAHAMAESSGVNFENDEHRGDFIQGLIDGHADVYRTDAQFRQDFEKLFGDALFGDGPRYSIDLDKLGELLVANRDLILVQTEEAPRPRP